MPVAVKPGDTGLAAQRQDSRWVTCAYTGERSKDHTRACLEIPKAPGASLASRLVSQSANVFAMHWNVIMSI